MNWKLLIFPLLLLSACNDRNAPSTALFEKVIEADKAATQAVCRDITTGFDSLSAKYQLDTDQESFFQDYKILEKHGYLTARQTKATDVFGTAVDAWEVALTPKWATDFDTPSDGERCGGSWRAQKVNSFTPPAEVNGVRVSAVTGTQGYTGWASDPELRAVFNLPPLITTTEKTYTRVLKNVGWEVAGVSK